MKCQCKVGKGCMMEAVGNLAYCVACLREAPCAELRAKEWKVGPNFPSRGVTDESPRRADESRAYREMRIERDSLQRQLESLRALYSAKKTDRSWWMKRCQMANEKLKERNAELLDARRERDYWIKRAGELFEEVKEKVEQAKQRLTATPGELDAMEERLRERDVRIADLEAENRNYRGAYDHWYKRWLQIQRKYNNMRVRLRKAERALRDEVARSTKLSQQLYDKELGEEDA